MEPPIASVKVIASRRKILPGDVAFMWERWTFI
jgi:hypothetical protein